MTILFENGARVRALAWSALAFAGLGWSLGFVAPAKAYAVGSGPAATTPPEVPAAIAAPKMATVSGRWHATGVQIYTCAAALPANPGAGGASGSATAAATPPAPASASAFTWTLKAPEATLTDASGASVARHGAGPTWTSVDGSSVAAKKIAQADAPTPDAVPWLLLRATTTSGHGVFTGTTFVQRIATSKGKPPATGCDAKTAGAETRVAYAADYVFYKGGDSEAQPVLPVGTPAPAFTATSHDGHTIALDKLKGKFVVLYFYPKDDTPGCTKEACEFRDNWTKLQSLGVAVFGVSGQDSASHQAFAEKYHLPFPLIPDESGAIAAKYLVPFEGGKAKRTTYLIGKDGRIAHVWTNVKPIGHAAEILQEVAPR